jgi:hypothetical protein
MVLRNGAWSRFGCIFMSGKYHPKSALIHHRTTKWSILPPKTKTTESSVSNQIKSLDLLYCCLGSIVAVFFIDGHRLEQLGRSADAEVIDQHLGMKSRTRLTTLSGSWTVLRLKAFVNQLLKTEDWSMGQTDTLDGIEKWWRVRLPEVQ